MSDDAFEMNLKPLDKLIRALGAKPPKAKIGVLGSRRSDSQLSNAQIGAFHEFGTSTHEVRSFLRMPLTDHLQGELEQSGMFTREVAERVIAEGSLRPWVGLAALVAEGVVQTAFDTGGYGKWPPSDMRYKKNPQTLVETQQLRNAITSKVEG